MSRAIKAFVAGLLLLGAACSGDDDAAEVLEGQNAGENESTTTTSGEDEATTGRSPETTEATTGDESSDDESRGTSRTTMAGGGGNDSVPVRLDVVGLERDGDLLVLELVLTNEAEETDDPDQQLYVSPLHEFGGGESRADLAGVGLIDQVEQKMYLPALDSADVCLCSDMTRLPRIDPGDSVDLTATFGGVPEDVDTVDVHVPGFPLIAGLAVG